MSTQKFDYIITQVAPNAPINALSKQLAKVLKLEASHLELQLNDLANQHRQPFRLLRQTSLQNIEKLNTFLNKYGVQGEHRESAPVDVEVVVEATQYVCPACHHQQVDDGNETCQKCGVVGSRYEAFKRKKAIFESERRYQQSDIQHNLDEAKKNRERAEEDALREEARRQLGVRTKRQQKTTQWLLGTAMVAAVSGGVYWFIQPQLSSTHPVNEAVPLAATDKPMDEGVSAHQEVAGHTVQGKAGVTLQAQGGHLTVNLPESAPYSSTSHQPHQPHHADSVRKESGEQPANVITAQNIPDLSDHDAQRLALSLYQQAQTVSNPEQQQMAMTTARLLAYSLGHSQQRKALLQLVHGGAWQVPKAITTPDFYAPEVDLKSFEKQIEQANQQSLAQGERQLQQLMARTKAKGAYYQARLMSRFLHSRYQLLQANAKTSAVVSANDQAVAQQMARFLPYLDQIAKLAWQTPDARQQVLVQGSLSQVYHLFGEEKLASMNLIMAVQNSRFIDNPIMMTNALMELAHYQQQAGAYQAAHQLYQLVEQRMANIPAPIRAEYYAKVSQGFASLRDIQRATALFEKIAEPLWLQKAMQAVETLGIAQQTAPK
ncbi:MAG: hypothetical protein ACWA5U_03895 [bacterium]